MVTALVAVLAVLWLFPVGWAVLNSLRSYDYTAEHGYVSLGGWTLQNYQDAWKRGNFAHYLLNSVYITVPAVVLSLLLAPASGSSWPGSASASTWPCSGCSPRPTCCPHRPC